MCGRDSDVCLTYVFNIMQKHLKPFHKRLHICAYASFHYLIFSYMEVDSFMGSYFRKVCMVVSGQGQCFFFNSFELWHELSKLRQSM